MIDEKLSKKISWVQFICAIIVVADHSFDYISYCACDKNAIENVIYSLSIMFSRTLTSIAMPIFFMISSFLLYKDWNKKTSILEWYKKKLSSRFKSLVVPYILWNIVWMVAFVLMGRWGIIDNNIDTSISIQNAISGIFFAKYNEVFWFMQTLIFYVIISPLIGCIIQSKFSYLFIFASAALSICNFTSYIANMGTFYNFFFYVIGAFLAIRVGSIKIKDCKKINYQKTLWGIFLLIISLIYLYFAKTCKAIESIEIVNILMVCLGVIGFWSIFDFVSKKDVNWITKSSFIIYAMHKPIQQLYNKIIDKLLEPSLLTHLFNLYGGIIFTASIILILVLFMRKKLPKLLYVFNGWRNI